MSCVDVGLQSARGTNITVDTLCGIMSDVSRGSEVERYAAVNDLILNVYEEKCQDFKYENMISELSQTTWNSSVSEGGMKRSLIILITRKMWSHSTCRSIQAARLIII